MTLLAGRYRLLSRIGQGGMGAVWRAVDELLRQEVAVKEVLLPRDLDEPQRAEMRERTLREARAAARLRSHPSIVTVHDVVLEDGRPWIIMELVRGRSLQALLRKEGRQTPERVAAIGVTMLDALTAAHTMGILHRDVKPGNVMVTDDERVLLTDFGIASVAGDVNLTQTGSVSGSPGYIAPERLRGEPDGPPSDLWSLAATLYTAVEGNAPFHRDNPAAVMAAVLMHEPHPMRRAGPLGQVLMAMLDKDPVRRMPAGHAAALLRDVAAGSGGFGGAAPKTAPSMRHAPKKRAPVFAAAGLATVLVAGGGAAWWFGTADRPVSSPTPTTTAVSTAKAAKATEAVEAAKKAVLTSNPEACALVTQAQIRKLLGTAAKQEFMTNDACQWMTPGGEYLQIQKIQLDSETTARLTFDTSRATEEDEPKRDPTTKLRLGARIGDATIGWTRDAGAYNQTRLVVRTANVAMWLYYSGPKSGYETIDAFAKLIMASLHKAG
ncbi:serine/threonine protein kinase [Herbidospora galbida]|uniref:non-specific serine/threonine protein kinase n=1 Tax=Herbidospora galbida TaxID=2575442 RepID=A0A4U3ML79_9ACTN|nr:serine/threonine-protein kinase [Herbidospora galbida]TKK90231.1 serine/threonine protein kinase [Herbidospora galbida]